MTNAILASACALVAGLCFGYALGRSSGHRKGMQQLEQTLREIGRIGR